VHGIPPEQVIYNSHSNYYTRLIIKENQKLGQIAVYNIVDLAQKILTRLSMFLANPAAKNPLAEMWRAGTARQYLRLIGA
jgi:hypothetical protein